MKNETPRQRQVRFRKMVKGVLVDILVATVVYLPIIWMLADFFSKSSY